MTVGTGATAGSAVAIVRLLLNLDDKGESEAQPDLDMVNALIDELDLAAARATINELGLLASGVLRVLEREHPGADVDEFVTRWALRVARDDIEGA